MLRDTEYKEFDRQMTTVDGNDSSSNASLNLFNEICADTFNYDQK